MCSIIDRPTFQNLLTITASASLKSRPLARYNRWEQLLVGALCCFPSCLVPFLIDEALQTNYHTKCNPSSGSGCWDSETAACPGGVMSRSNGLHRSSLQTADVGAYSGLDCCCLSAAPARHSRRFRMEVLGSRAQPQIRRLNQHC